MKTKPEINHSTPDTSTLSDGTGVPVHLHIYDCYCGGLFQRVVARDDGHAKYLAAMQGGEKPGFSWSARRVSA